MSRARILAVSVSVVALAFAVSSIQAGVAWSGDVDPADPAAWTSATQAHIGKTASGTMDITDGGTVISGNSVIGDEAGATGLVTVDGVGSTWSSDSLFIGFSGGGELSITDGGQIVSFYSMIGVNTGSVGEVIVDGVGSALTSEALFVGDLGNGRLSIVNGGLVSASAPFFVIDNDGDGDSFIRMATGGMLALKGDAASSLASFLALVGGTDAIDYWDAAISDWADITTATYGDDYTVTYMTDGHLAGYTVLNVTTPIPEPAGLVALALGAVMGIHRRR